MTKIAVFALMAVAATPSFAEDKYFGEHGGYQVAGFTSTSDRAAGCIMTEEFEGPGDTRVHIVRNADTPENVWMTVENYNWTTKKDAEYENVSYQFDDGAYDRTALGTVSSIYHGLLAGFPRKDFLDTFSKATYLHIYREKTLVDKLNMSGSAAARSAFDRCWSWMKIADAAVVKERNRYNHIPKDPFAPTTKPEGK